MRLDALVACFVASFQRPPSFALRVPGRINLIGEVPARIVSRPVQPDGLVAARCRLVRPQRGLRLLEWQRRGLFRVKGLA